MIGSNLFFRFNDLINFNLSNQDKIYINRIFYQGLVESLFNLIPWIKIKIDGIKNLKNIDLKKKIISSFVIMLAFLIISY